MCKKENFCDAGRNACIQCTFNLCWTCLSPPSNFVKLSSTCPKKHKLKFNKNISPEYAIGFKCDICGIHGFPAEGRWNCDECHFDICKNCKSEFDFDKKILVNSITLPEIASEERDQCKICFHYKINTVLIPCGHLCICSDCSEKLTKKVCPVCNTSVQMVVKTYQT